MRESEQFHLSPSHCCYVLNKLANNKVHLIKSQSLSFPKGPLHLWCHYSGSVKASKGKGVKKLETNLKNAWNCSDLLLSGPLPPEHLSLSNGGHSTRSLRASWQSPSGVRGNYAGTLLETKSQLVVKNVTAMKGGTNVTFDGLIPGRQYTLKMMGVAGPYPSIIQTASDWTCEYVIFWRSSWGFSQQVLSLVDFHWVSLFTHEQEREDVSHLKE